MIQYANPTPKKRSRVEFAVWLRDRLQQRPDLNQKRLADLLGVYASTVSFWMSGRSKPSPEKVDALAKIFDVEPSVLYPLLGFDAGQPYQFKVLGPIVEEIDNLLAMVDDPEDRELIEERLKHDVLAARDMLEALNQRRNKRENT